MYRGNQSHIEEWATLLEADVSDDLVDTDDGDRVVTDDGAI